MNHVESGRLPIMENPQPPPLPDPRCMKLARTFVQECIAPESFKEKYVVDLSMKIEKTIDEYIDFIRSAHP